MSSTTKIDEEYHSTDNECEIDNSDDMLDEKEYEKEIEWRKRYIPPPATVSSASEIGSFVNETRKKDHAWGESSSEDEKSKKVQGRGQRKKKIEQALPELMSSVKEAAEAHTRAMAKWEKTFDD